MAETLQLLQCVLQPLQFLTCLCELAGSSQLLIIGEVPSRLGDQGVDVAGLRPPWVWRSLAVPRERPARLAS